MNYIEKQYEEIFESMLEDSVSNGLISHAEDFTDFINNKQDISNYYVMDKAVIATMFAKVYQDITSVYESAKVEYAEGSDLDNIGEIVGIPRPEATCAEVIVTFTLRDIYEGDINIPAGITLSTASGIEYVTLEDIFIANGNAEATISARALNPGVGSKIIENSLTRIIDNLPYNFDVNNPKSSSGGYEAYSDDEYRYLLMNWIKIKLKGSFEAYENYFANFDGIDSWKVVPNWNGTGTIKCILDPGTDYQLNKAYQELQDTVTQASEDISMFAPEYKPISIYAKVNVDIDQINPFSVVEKEDIRSKVISGIKVFIDGGYRVDGSWYEGLILGEDFIPHKLAVFLDEEVSELKNITFNYPDDYVEISDDEMGVSGSITIEMI